jgi:hypothetical protein
VSTARKGKEVKGSLLIASELSMVSDDMSLECESIADETARTNSEGYHFNFSHDPLVYFTLYAGGCF